MEYLINRICTAAYGLNFESQEVLMRSDLKCVFVLGLFVITACSPGSYEEKNDDFPVLTGEYLGQTPPGMEAELFAPGLVSTGLYERDIAISPDGSELYYGVVVGNRTTILVSRQEDGRWTEPEQASFINGFEYYYFEPALSPDGKRMLFLTNRPPEGEPPKSGWGYQHIWAVDRGDDGIWMEPYDLGPAVNANRAEFFPSVTESGTLYFTRAEGDGRYGIYRSPLIEGQYKSAEALPDEVNGKNNPYNACISRDESLLIACIAGRDDGVNTGLPEYYVFFRTEEDTWSEGVNLGEGINFRNSSALSPHFSGDGKYFFFASNKTDPEYFSTARHLNWGLIQKIHRSPQNGSGDIYWVNAERIRRLNPNR